MDVSAMKESRSSGGGAGGVFLQELSASDDRTIVQSTRRVGMRSFMK